MKRSLKRLGKFIPYAIIALLLIKTDLIKVFKSQNITIFAVLVILICFGCIGYIYIKQKKEETLKTEEKRKAQKKKTKKNTPKKGRKK